MKASFGCLVNDPLRLDMVLKQSKLPKDVKCHVLSNAESATKGLNKLLEKCEADGSDVAILVHQDMYFRQGWLEAVADQIRLLPESWVVCGPIGKDMEGLICGQFHDMRVPMDFNTKHLHEFPQPACCFDEAVIVINLAKHFRFDESLDGYDLYGTLAVLQAWEMGGTAWVIDAWCEHFCMRPFTWFPNKAYRRRYKKLYDRFAARWRVDSTAIQMSGDPDERKEQQKLFMTSAA